MKRCLNCRRSYEENLSECPYCGYKPHTKPAARRKISDTQEFVIPPTDKTDTSSRRSEDLMTTSKHSGAFYLKSGERLNDRYSVLSVMGYATFGVAYECFDSHLQRHVTVKEYIPSYLVTRSPNGREVVPISAEAEDRFLIGVDKFIDDNQKLSENDVTCVPALVECFQQNNTAYVATEIVQGEALSSILQRQGKLAYQSTITLITSVLQGLRQLNRLGIIHGDICPENIIITTDKEAYLIDYNLSDFNKNVYTQREAGKLRGGYSALEMYYMNMEQGPWSDVYAAAATMYKMLTGITVPSAIKRNTNDTLTPLSRLGIPITEGAEKAMLKALKVDYTKRTQNPEDFLNGLMGDGFDNVSVMRGSGNKEHSEKKPPKPKKNREHNSKALNTIIVFLLIAIIGVIIWLFISGVFAMPEALSGIFNKGNSDSSDTTLSEENNPYNDIASNFVGDFYDNENTFSEEEDEDESEDTSSSGFLDNILSRITTNSSEEEEDSSSEEEYYYEDESSYYEEDYNDNNYDNNYYDDYYYDDTSSEENYYEDYNDNTESKDNNEDTESGGFLDDVTSSINDVLGDVTSGAGEYFNNIFDNRQQ